MNWRLKLLMVREMQWKLKSSLVGGFEKERKKKKRKKDEVASSVK